MYITDFLYFYKRLGFNHIFLYDNNDINGERFEKVIPEKLLKTFVTIINYRGFRGDSYGPQMSSYYDCYDKNNLNYDWLAFFDVDEYLNLSPDNLTIQQLLHNSRYNNCESIKFNWKVFTDNNQLDYENKPLNERFTVAVNISNVFNTACKMIIKGNLSNYSLRKTFHPHDIFYSNYSCNSNGIICKERYIKPVYKYASLYHYYTKSIKEYCLKVKRGRAFVKKTPINELKTFYFNNFFEFNKKTKEKVDIYNKAFNTSFK